MKAPALLLTVALLVAGVTAVPLSGLAQPGDAVGSSFDVLQTSENDDETEKTPPGARLAGVVSAQGAEVRGEVDSRALDTALDRAASVEARARIVARQVGQLEERLVDLEERNEELRREYRKGNITTATYVAESTKLTARTESARGLTNQSRAAARDLPPNVAEEQGLNVTAIALLEERAANLTGPEVARIARSIAGPEVGQPVGVGPPDHAGPPDDRSVGPPGDVSPGPGDDGSAAGSENGSVVPPAGGNSSAIGGIDAPGDANETIDDIQQ